jgi:pyruvate dehydrogenase (quinone)
MNALIDLAHYAEQEAWPDQRIVICVLDNRDLNQVTWEQRVMSGDAKLDASQILPAVDYAGYARLLGLHGEAVDSPAEVGPAWDRALAAGRPAVLSVRTDPEVPPLPPHITFEQASSIGRAIAAGDPAAPRFVKQSLRGKLAELLTR